MTHETKEQLHPETLSHVQKLLRMMIDSHDGMLWCAQATHDTRLADQFRDMAADRATMASVLQRYVALNDETPVDDGSLLGAAHRLWTWLQSTTIGDDTTTLVEEALRGERLLKDAYQEALLKTTGSAMNDVLVRQFALINEQLRRLEELAT